MNMSKISAAVILLLTIVLILMPAACTKKKNLVGDNWSGITPLVAIDSTFGLGYSYTHTSKVKGNEGNIVCGSEAGIEAIGILRFTGLPDTLTIIEQPTLQLVAVKRSPLRRNPVVLSFHKLDMNWAADSTDLISDVNISPLGMDNFTVQDSINSAGDTLSIAIPNNAIINWKTEDVTGLNLVIKALSGWLEFKATESGRGALLKFKYQVPGSTDTLSYSQRTVLDSYRVTGTQSELTENTWLLKNLHPQRIYFKNLLSNSLFIDQDGIELNATDRRRMTINKAELVLFVKNNPYYGATRAYFYPYRVKPDTLVIPQVLTDADLQNIGLTFNSVAVMSSDSVKINITAITQAFTSGNLANNGIVFRNTSELQNFGNIEFWHTNDAPEGKKPYVKIYYTVPYLKGD